MRLESVFVAVSVLTACVTAANAQDVEAGKTVFKKCAVCHAADSTTNKVGPHLGGLIGRTAGTATGFNYSKAMATAGAGGQQIWGQSTANLPQYALRIDAKGDIYAEGVDELLYGRLSNVL